MYEKHLKFVCLTVILVWDILRFAIPTKPNQPKPKFTSCYSDSSSKHKFNLDQTEILFENLSQLWLINFPLCEVYHCTLSWGRWCARSGDAPLRLPKRALKVPLGKVNKPFGAWPCVKVCQNEFLKTVKNEKKHLSTLFYINQKFTLDMSEEYELNHISITACLTGTHIAKLSAQISELFNEMNFDEQESRQGDGKNCR